MLSVTQQVIEKRTSRKDSSEKDLTVKAVPYDTAKRLGDVICIKYKKAFDLLKDK